MSVRCVLGDQGEEGELLLAPRQSAQGRRGIGNGAGVLTGQLSNLLCQPCLYPRGDASSHAWAARRHPSSQARHGFLNVLLVQPS